MRYLLDEQEAYDSEVTAFRLSAEKNDYQPMQEIKVDWDGTVTYREEPALLSGNHQFTNEPFQRDLTKDVFGVFQIEEDEVAKYLEDLSQDVIDLLNWERSCNHLIRSEEAWIEVSNPHGITGIGLFDSPNTPSVYTDTGTLDFGQNESILPPSTWETWTSLVSKAEKELKE